MEFSDDSDEQGEGEAKVVNMNLGVTKKISLKSYHSLIALAGNLHAEALAPAEST